MENRTMMQEAQTIQIVYITDDAFVLATCVSIYSLYVNRSRDARYCVHVVCNQVAQARRERLLALSAEGFEVRIVEAQMTELHERFVKEGFPVTISATLKFTLPQMFEKLDRILYIDGDTIIQGDLCALYHAELGEAYAGVVKDYHALTFKGNVWERLGIELEAYFNSGVMLLNLDRMRRDGITEKLIDYRLNGINYYMDQDALNVVFGRQVRYLGFEYNMTVTNWRNKTSADLAQYYGMEEAQDKYDYFRRAQIVHYASGDKPWAYYDTHYADVWMSYFIHSPMCGGGVKRDTLHTVIADKRIEQIRIQTAGTARRNRQCGKCHAPKGARPLVSVIIPVYNAQQYVGETIDSLMDQTLSAFEVICVDDGSTDGSREVIEQLAKADRRIRLISQENMHAGAARNRGLAEAEGEYVLFLDADDMLAPGALEAYAMAGIRTGADVIVSNAGHLREDGGIERSKYWLREQFLPYEDVFSAEEMYAYIFNFTTGGPGGKCFRRSYVLEKELQYLTISKSEDFYFVHGALVLARRIAVLREPLYLIRKVETSLESQKDRYPTLFCDAMDLFEEKLREYGVYGQVRQSLINENLSRYQYNLASMKTREGYEQVLERLRGEYRAKLGVGFYPHGYYYYPEKYRYVCRALGLKELIADMDGERKSAGARLSPAGRLVKRAKSLAKKGRNLYFYTRKHGLRAGARKVLRKLKRML